MHHEAATAPLEAFKRRCDNGEIVSRGVSTPIFTACELQKIYPTERFAPIGPLSGGNVNWPAPTQATAWTAARLMTQNSIGKPSDYGAMPDSR